MLTSRTTFVLQWYFLKSVNFPGELISSDTDSACARQKIKNVRRKIEVSLFKRLLMYCPRFEDIIRGEIFY